MSWQRTHGQLIILNYVLTIILMLLCIHLLNKEFKVERSTVMEERASRVHTDTLTQEQIMKLTDAVSNLHFLVDYHINIPHMCAGDCKPNWGKNLDIHYEYLKAKD